jgi:hypothetical protein
MENEDYCLQCGYRQRHRPSPALQPSPSEPARDPYEQLIDLVSKALELVQNIASRADSHVAAYRREAKLRRQQVRRIARALKVLKGERLLGERREGSRKPGPKPKLRALSAAEAK